ncbi:MAG: malonyl-ACP O-methyltransferase BioC [Rhodocyclales bacterium]|nr:malonyl-ACP O-methyltransferase BioC [Rhodocyclales bacterium]
MTLPDKQRIRDSFARAAASYDAAAVLQREVCGRLLARLDAAGAAAPARILDAGCGTGYGARLLHGRWAEAVIVAADFAEAMTATTRHSAPAGTACTVADIEALPFADAAFDLWWSSLTVQWCDAATVLREAARVLRRDGRLALSTLGSGTYAELRTAFAGVDRHRHTLDFAAADRLAETAQAAGLRDVALLRETVTLHYPDLKQLLGAVKAIGANALGAGRRTGMMGKAAWQALADAYERQRVAEGLPASYDVLLLTARK